MIIPFRPRRDADSLSYAPCDVPDGVIAGRSQAARMLAEAIKHDGHKDATVTANRLLSVRWMVRNGRLSEARRP